MELKPRLFNLQITAQELLALQSTLFAYYDSVEREVSEDPETRKEIEGIERHLHSVRLKLNEINELIFGAAFDNVDKT